MFVRGGATMLRQAVALSVAAGPISGNSTPACVAAGHRKVPSVHTIGMPFGIAILCFLTSTVVAAVHKRVESAPSGWTGRLEIRDRAFVDASGNPVLPLCAHFGEAFSAWTRRADAVEAQLQEIKAAGYDCIRFWDNLGEYSEAWRGKEVTPFSWINGDGVRVPTTPDYYGTLERFLAVLKRHGLTAHHSRGDLGRGTPAIPLDRVVEHSGAVARVYDRVGWEVLALYEGNNEDFQNGNFGPAGLLNIVEPLQTRGALVASSAPPPDSDDAASVVAYSRGFSVRYYHSRRDGTAADRLERKFISGYKRPEGAPHLAWDGEPIGPNHEAGRGVTVNHTEDVEEIGLLHAMTLFGGKSGATYMSQHGVFWGGPIHRQAGFHVTPRMRAVLYNFAPDVMRWTLYDAGRDEAVLHLASDGRGDPVRTERRPRLDQAVSPDRRRVVGLIYDGQAPARFRNDLGCRARLMVVRPVASEDVLTDTFRLEPGAVHEVDYRVGRLVLAECVK
jgi:hypothetical protein